MSTQHALACGRSRGAGAGAEGIRQIAIDEQQDGEYCYIKFHTPLRGWMGISYSEARTETSLALPGFGQPAGSYFRTVSSQVTDFLRRDIQRGVLRPGQRLRQREMAERMDVSTTPVREAFQALEAEGFLRVHPHRGALVLQPSAAEVREVYEIRKSLEGLAITHAASHATQMQQETLWDLLHRMENSNDREVWAQLDQEFHLCIYQTADMPRLVSMVGQLRAASSYYIESAYDDKVRWNEALADHRRILMACLNGNVQEARSAVQEHLEHTAKFVISAVDTVPTVQESA